MKRHPAGFSCFPLILLLSDFDLQYELAPITICASVLLQNGQNNHISTKWRSRHSLAYTKKRPHDPSSAQVF